MTDPERLDWLDRYIRERGRVIVNDNALPHGGLRAWIDCLAAIQPQPLPSEGPSVRVTCICGRGARCSGEFECCAVHHQRPSE